MADESPLSEREADIMRQVVTGASNREIAKVLEISPNTVKVHLRNIYEKLGVASRTEATLVVLRERWVEVEGMGPEPQPEPVPEMEALPIHEGMTVSVQFPDAVAGAPEEGSAPRLPARLLVGLGATVILLLLAILGVLLLRPTSPTTAPVAEGPSRWQQLVHLPAPRQEAAVGVLNRMLLVVGGEGATGLTGDTGRYDLATGRWESRAPLPIPVRAAGAAVLSGDLFVVGGIAESGEATERLQRYDPQRDEWTESALPAPIARGAVATFEGALFLFGGWDGADVQDTVYRYRPDDGQWEAIATLPSPRADLAAATVDTGIVLVGGTDEAGRALAEVLHFDPRSSNPLRAEAPLPSAEATPRLVALGNALYLLGAEGLLERDPDRQWHHLPQPEAALPTGAALVASDPYIIVLGGEQAGEPTSAVWQYQAIYRSFVPVVVPGGP